MGTADSVFFYASQVRYPSTQAGLLFAVSLEADRTHEGSATPFDSGALWKHCRPPADEDPRLFFERHTLPLVGHRRYLRQSLESLFADPLDDLNGKDPEFPGPIGLPGEDPRRWTHEVRIARRVLVRGAHLQAVFIPASRVAAVPGVEELRRQCQAGLIDWIDDFDAPKNGEFETLRDRCISYIRKQITLRLEYEGSVATQ